MRRAFVYAASYSLWFDRITVAPVCGGPRDLPLRRHLLVPAGGVGPERARQLRLGRAIRIPADEIRRIIEAGTVPAEKG